MLALIQRIIGRMKWIFVSAVLLIVAASIFFAYAAHNTINQAYLGDSVYTITANDVKPSQCDHLNLTGGIYFNQNGSGGNDLIYAADGGSTINGGNGDDCIIGRDGNDNLSGGSGNDVILGFGGSDTLNGNDGNDTILGGDGWDSINGGAGNDYLDGQGGLQFIIYGGTGTDACYNAWFYNGCE